MPTPLDDTPTPAVLVVTAHPDDVDFGAAGTVANMTDAGIEVVYCLVTDGQAGGFDHSIPRTEMAMIRRAEQTKAAAEVGVTRLEFLGHMDGEVVLVSTVVVDMRGVVDGGGIVTYAVHLVMSTVRISFARSCSMDMFL